MQPHNQHKQTIINSNLYHSSGSPIATTNLQLFSNHKHDILNQQQYDGNKTALVKGKLIKDVLQQGNTNQHNTEIKKNKNKIAYNTKNSKQQNQQKYYGKANSFNKSNKVYSTIQSNNNNKNKNNTFVHTTNPNVKRIQKLYTQPTNNVNNNNNHIVLYSSNNNKFVIKAVNNQQSNKTNGHLKTQVSKQKLYQQNLQLKTTINQLKQQLNKQKIQTVLQKKKNKKYTKKLGIQFKKDFYYSFINKNYQKSQSFDSDDNDEDEVKKSIQNKQHEEQSSNNNNSYTKYRNININFSQINQNNGSKSKHRRSQQRCNTQHKKYSEAKVNLNYNNSNQYHIEKKYSVNIPQNINNDGDKFLNSAKVKKSIKNLANFKQNSINNINPSSTNNMFNNHSSDYLIAGIKQKYEQLRQQNKKLQKQLEKAKQVNGYKKAQEMSIYCNTLQNHNKKLVQQIQIYKIKLQSLIDEGKQRSKDEILHSQAAVLELISKNDKLKQKNAKIRQQNKQIKHQSDQHTKTIAYLEKLLILNENTQHHAINATKKLALQVQTLSNELDDERQSNKIFKQSYIKKLQQLNQQYKKQRDDDRILFEETLHQKIMLIKKLQKQVNYLGTIVEHWKPHNQQDSNNQSGETAKSRHNKRKTQQNFKNLLTQINQQESVRKLQQKIQQKQKQLKIEPISISLNNKTIQVDQSLYSKINTRRTQMREKLQKVCFETERKRKTAAFKNSQNAKKMRQVAVQKIGDLPQYIRFRLIGEGINLQKACQLLDYFPASLQQNEAQFENNLLNSLKSKTSITSQFQQLNETQKWKIHYITLAEIKSILLSQPFKLKPQDALLLSRYMIEDQCTYEKGDQHNGFVYFDEENQIERTIAKSILKAFIKCHSDNLIDGAIESNENNKKCEDCQQQWIRILQKNGVRLNTALISIAPSGLITKDKWEDLLQSINVQISLNTKQWTIGKMVIQSQDMSKLKYQSVMKYFKQ